VSRRLLLTAHISTSVGILGADLVLLTLGVHGRLGADPVTVYPAMRILASYVIAPLAGLAVGTGLLLALRSPGLLGQTWVLAKLSISTALTILVLLAAIPGLTAAENAALSPAPAVTERMQLTYALMPAFTLSLLLLNVALAVYKPRRRTRARSTDRRRQNAAPH
jgi:hypothetical protein